MTRKTTRRTSTLEPDPVIEAFKRDVDRTLLRENLARSPEQRVLDLMELLRADEEFRRAGRALRSTSYRLSPAAPNARRRSRPVHHRPVHHPSGGSPGRSTAPSIPTRDLDVVYDRSPDNLRRLVDALAPHGRYLRGASPGLPFRWEEDTIRRGLNFSLTTGLGALDLLGEIAGGGNYGALLPHTVTVTVFGVECRCLSLEQLIVVKRAAGRVRDLQAVADLEALLEERGGHA